MMRAHNFSSGPAAMPSEVLIQAQNELLSYDDSGMSIMEMSHRSKYYDQIHNETMELIRQLLGIPANYKIGLLQGGARLQFAMIPLNFMSKGRQAGYVLTDTWSEEAFKEAEHVGSAYIAGKNDGYRRIPDSNEIEIQRDTTYIHLTSNNTIVGTQYHDYPQLNGVHLIADMTSDIMSKEIDVNSFSLIYAGAQKNLGPSGVTLVILREDLLEEESSLTMPALRYSSHLKENCMLATPPTYNIYLVNLFAKWIQQQGGVAMIEKQNQKKATLLYDFIDQSGGFYKGYSERSSRSHMNITFHLPTKELDQKFIAQAYQEGFIGVNGHHRIGGCRASIYNGVSLQSCMELEMFMKHFQDQNG
ncbi:phosphoserine aminotransferase [Croceifilum oryzae]|uniref:Phosphoserine aminotransferase n=1 Tax=Croceifilum oryzae TaxID=1553429 RepID=A0AAJ1TK23_9BACL|nr:3-phosphoserine/phosphohydroxythreonine transaminase [Croceifilum oryzae]MDQ0417962.1 phosphoserine aminotransferase [Croceifilum oryzae]